MGKNVIEIKSDPTSRRSREAHDRQYELPWNPPIFKSSLKKKIIFHHIHIDILSTVHTHGSSGYEF